MPKRGKRRDGRIQNRKEARLDPQDDNGAPSKTIKENSSNIQGRRVMDMSRDENTPSEWASVLRGHRSVEDNALGSTSADLTNCRDDFNKSGRKKYPLKRGRPAKKGRKFIEHRSKTTQMSEQSSKNLRNRLRKWKNSGTVKPGEISYEVSCIELPSSLLQGNSRQNVDHSLLGKSKMDERRFPQVVKSNRIRDICMDNNRESPCTQSRILKKNKSNKLQLNVGSTSHPAKGRKKKKQANKQKHLDVIDISSDYVNEQNYAVCDSNESICASELPLKSANGFCLDPTSMNNSQEKPSMMMMPSSKLRTTRSSGGDSLMDGLGSSLLTRKQSKRLKRRASFRAAKAKIKSSGRGRRSCLSQKLVRYDFATDSTKMTDFQSKSPNSIYSVSSYELHKTPDADSINAYKSSAEACGDTIKSDCDVIKNSDDNVSGCTQRGTPSKLLCNIKKTSTIWSTPIGICINDCSRSSVTAESNLGSCFEKNDKKNLKSKPSAISMNDKSCSDQSKKMNLRSLKPSTISKNNQSRSDPLERKMKEVGAAADDSSSIEILPSVLKLAKESSHCKSPSKKTRSGPDQNSSVTPKMANLAKATHSTLSTSKKFELKTLDSTLNSSTSETLTAKSASPNQKYEVNILESVSTVPNSGTMTPKSVNSGKKSGSKTLDSDSNLPKSGALNFKYGSPSKNSKVKAQESVSISLKSGALNPKSRSPSKKSKVTTSDSVSNSSTSGALNNKSGSPSKKSEVKTPDSVSNLSQSGALITNSDSPSKKSIVKVPDSVSNSPKSGALNPKILEVKTTDLVLDTPKYRTLTPKTELSSNKAEVQSPDLALNIVLKTASSSTNSQVKNPDSDPDLIQSGPYLPKIGSLTMKPEVKTSDLVSALPKSGTSRQKPGISCVVSDSAKYSTKSEVKTSDLVSVSPKSITLLPKAVTSNSISDSRKSGILNRQSNFPKDSTVIDAIDLTSSAVMENNNHSRKISEVKVPFAESASPAASELTLVAANATIPVVTIATASACTQVVRTAAANAMTPVVTTVTANAKSPVVTTAAANTKKPVVTTAIANTTIPVVMTATANANTPVVTTAAANDNTPVVLTSATNVNTPVVTTAAANANTPVALTSAADAKKVKDSSSRSLEASSSVELLLANSNSLITPSDGKEKNSSFSSDFDCVAEEEMQPFMTESVRKLIKKKRAAYCMYKQSQSAQLWKFYARLKKQVAEEVKRVSAEAGTQENMSKVKGRLAATQRVKLNHIVLLTDMMDMFLQDRLKKFVKVSFIHRQNLGYHNALHLITDHEWYGKGTLFVMMCGVTTAVRFVKQENCGDFCWMSLLERYSLVSSKTTDISNHLKESALLLRKDVEENKTDKIIFLGLLPIQLAAFDTYLLGRHFEITGHSVPHLHHRLYSEHQGVLCRSLGIFNKWVEADRNGIGYECWNLVDEPFMYYSARYQKMIFKVGTEPDGRVLSYQDFKKRLSSVKNAIDSSFNLWKERLVEDGQSNEKIFVNMDLKSHFKEKIEGGTAVCDGGISLVKSSDFSDTEPSKNNGKFDTDSAQVVKDGKESQVVKVIPDTIKIKPCTSKVNEAQINNKEKACNIIESPQNPVIHPLTTESSSPKAKSQKIDELHIVLICDKQDSYLQAMNLPNLSCIYSPNMTFTSALHLIEKTELPSSNVLYIVLCGIDNILLTIEEPECKQKKCLHILERPALMSNEVEGNLRALISEALYLRQKVSELRPLSHVVFSGILPANLFQMDNYAVIRHSNVCKHKAPLHTKDFFHPMSDVMNRVLTLYNSWAKEDAAMSGFPVWHVEQVFVSFHAVSKSEMACTFNHTTERDGRSLTLVAEKARKEALLRVVKYTQGEAIPQRPSCKEKYKERKFHPNSIVVAYGNSRGSLLSLNIDKLRDLVTCIQKEAVHARLQNGDIPERTLIVLLSDLDSVLKYQQDDDCKRLGCSSSLQRIELISENVDRLFSVLVSKAQTLRKNVLEMNRNCNIIFTGLLPVDLRVINELVLKDHLRQCHHQGTYRPKKALLGENRVLGSAVTYFNQWALRDAERLGFPDFRMESILTSIKSSKDQFVFLNKFEHDGWTPTNFWQKRHLEVLTNSLRMTLASLFYEDSVDEYPSLSSFHVSGSKLSPSKSTSQDEVRYGSIRPLDHKDTWFTSEAARYSPPASPIVLMSNTLYSHILQRFSSPSVHVVLEQFLHLDRIPELLTKHQIDRNKTNIFIMPLGLYSVTEFFAHPQCQNCPQPLHILAYKGGQPPSGSAMASDIAGIIQTILQLKERIQRELGSDCQVLFVPPIRALVVQEENFRSHGALHDACEKNQAFCTNAAMLSVLRDFYNSFSAVWMTFMLKEPFYEPIRTSLKNYKAVIREENVVPVLDSKNYTLEMEPWIQMLQTVIEQLLSNNKMRKEIDMPLANPTFEVSSRETVSRVNCVVVVGLDFLWKDLKVSLGDKAQKVHFIHEDINFSTESREKFICLQEKFPDGTRWIILSSLALLFREVPSGQVLCDLYSCPKPLRFYDCMINMNLPCHALNKETESLVSNLVSQVKAFVRSARQFLRPHSELYIPPLSPLAAMVIGNRTSHSHIHTLNEAGAPVHFIYGRFLFWSRTHILLSKKWMEMILKSEEGSDLHNPILKYMDERIPAMSFVYSIQSMKRTAQARTKWISLIEELLLNRTDRESVQSLEVATNAQDSCSTSLENTDTSSDHRPSSGFAMQIHHPVSQSRCLEDSANDSSTKNNAEVKPTNGRKNPSPGKQATLDGASGSSSLTSMQNIKNEIHDSDVPFNNISVDNANHICVSKIKSEFLPMKQKSVVIQQEYYSSIFDRSKSQDLAVNSLTEENIKTVKHKLSCVSTSKSEVFEEFRELDAVTGKNLNVQENKDLVGDENLNEMSTPEGVKLFSTVNATSIINTCRGVELSSMVDATSESNSCRGVELSSTVNAKSVSNTSRGVELSSTVDTASVSSICRDLNDKNKEFITDKDDSSSNAHAQDVLRKAKEISISEDQVPISKKVSVLECVSSNTVLSDAHETNLEPVNDKATNSSCLKEKNLPIKDLSAVNNKDRLPLAQAASPREAFDQVPTESMARVNDEMEMQMYREGPATASTSSLLHKNDTDNLIVLKHANLLKCEDNIKTLSKKKCCSSTLFLPGGDDITDETVISRTSLQTLDYAMDARKTSSGSSRNRDKIDADYALPRKNSKSSLDSAMANDSFPSENNNSSLESTTANDSVPNENNISLEGTTANNSVPRENKNSTLEITTICNLPAEEKGKSSISSVSVMNKQMESAIASGREIEQRDTNIPTSTPLNKISSYIPYNKINISITLSEKNRCDEIYRAEQEHTNVTLNNDCSSRGSGNGTSQTVVKGKEISLVEPDKQNQVVNQGMNIPSLINRVPTLPLLSASSYLSTKSSMPTCVVHPIPVILGPVKQKKEKSQVKKEVAISGVSSKPTRRRCPGNFAEPPQGTLTTSSDNFHESWDNSPMDQSVQSVPSNESFSNLSLVQQKFSENGSHALVATTLAISPCTTTHSSIARDATIPIAMNTTYTIPEPPLNTYNKSSRLADLVAPFTIGSTPLKNSSLSFPGSPSAVITLTNFKKSFENEEDVAVSNDNKKRECKIITDKKVDKPTFGLIILNVSTSITINQMKQILEVFGPVESFGRPVNILGKPAEHMWVKFNTLSTALKAKNMLGSLKFAGNHLEIRNLKDDLIPDKKFKFDMELFRKLKRIGEACKVKVNASDEKKERVAHAWEVSSKKAESSIKDTSRDTHHSTKKTNYSGETSLKASFRNNQNFLSESGKTSNEDISRSDKKSLKNLDSDEELSLSSEEESRPFDLRTKIEQKKKIRTASQRQVLSDERDNEKKKDSGIGQKSPEKKQSRVSMIPLVAVKDIVSPSENEISLSVVSLSKAYSESELSEIEDGELPSVSKRLAHALKKKSSPRKSKHKASLNKGKIASPVKISNKTFESHKRSGHEKDITVKRSKKQKTDTNPAENCEESSGKESKKTGDKLPNLTGKTTADVTKIKASPQTKSLDCVNSSALKEPSKATDAKNTGKSSNVMQYSLKVTNTSEMMPNKIVKCLLQVMAAYGRTLQEKDGTIYRFRSLPQALIARYLLDGFRLLDTKLKVTLNNAMPAGKQPQLNPSKVIAKCNKLRNRVQDFHKEMADIARYEVEKEVNIYTFKVYQCYDMKCPATHVCHRYHSKEDRRRNPSLCTYSTELCPAVHKGLPCPRGDDCENAHSTVEILFHQERYRNHVCVGWKDNKRCPMKNQICPFAHPESPDLFFHPTWEDLYVEGLRNTLNFLTGAITNHFRLSIPDLQRANHADALPSILTIRIMVVTPCERIVQLLYDASRDLATNCHHDIVAITMESQMPDSSVVIGTPDSLTRLFFSPKLENGGVLSSFKISKLDALILDDITGLLKIFAHSPGSYARLKQFLATEGVNKVVVTEKIDAEEMQVASSLLSTYLIGVPQRSSSNEEVSSDVASESCTASQKNVHSSSNKAKDLSPDKAPQNTSRKNSNNVSKPLSRSSVELVFESSSSKRYSLSPLSSSSSCAYKLASSSSKENLPAYSASRNPIPKKPIEDFPSSKIYDEEMLSSSFSSRKRRREESSNKSSCIYIKDRETSSSAKKHISSYLSEKSPSPYHERHTPMESSRTSRSSSYENHSDSATREYKERETRSSSCSKRHKHRHKERSSLLSKKNSSSHRDQESPSLLSRKHRTKHTCGKHKCRKHSHSVSCKKKKYSGHDIDTATCDPLSKASVEEFTPSLHANMLKNVFQEISSQSSWKVLQNTLKEPIPQTSPVILQPAKEGTQILSHKLQPDHRIEMPGSIFKDWQLQNTSPTLPSLDSETLLPFNIPNAHGPTSSRLVPSPCVNCRHLKDMKSEEFQRLEKSMLEAHKSEYLVFLDVPEVHPQYEASFNMFKMNYLEKFGQDANKDHQNELWNNFWQELIAEEREESWVRKRKNLVKKFEFDESIRKQGCPCVQARSNVAWDTSEDSFYKGNRDSCDNATPLLYSGSIQAVASTSSKKEKVKICLASTLELLVGVSDTLGEFFGSLVKKVVEEIKRLGSVQAAFEYLGEADTIKLLVMASEDIQLESSKVNDDEKIKLLRICDAIKEVIKCVTS